MDNIKYEQMKQVDIQTVDANILMDIDTIKIRKEISKEERLKDFIENIKNPFCFKCNGIIVKAVYNDNGETLEEKLVSLFLIMNGMV